MSRDSIRFASEGVYDLPNLPPNGGVLACKLARIVNPRAISLDPARLVAVIDGLLEEALEELPLVLWETEDTIRFEMAETRVLLALSDGTFPGEHGLTLGLAAVGPDCADLATGLCQLLSHALIQRFPALDLLGAGSVLGHDAMIDADVAAILTEPFAASVTGLPPVETLVDQVWRRASVEVDAPRRLRPLAPQPAAPEALKQHVWAHRVWTCLRPVLGLPQIAPMRQPVRALALVLFLLGLAQGPLGQTASAETQIDGH